jgi:hypothetical protein
MDFIKKHYEKIILSIVLLGLVGALLGLPFLISSDQSRMKDLTDTIITTKVAPLPDLDLTRESGAAARLDSPAVFDFSTTNKLFNPVEWRRAADNTIFPVKTGKEIVEACVVAKITPLYFLLTFDSVETNGVAPRYVVGIERQAAASPAQRRRVQRYVSSDDPKKDLFTLVSVKGPPENPDQLVLKLADTGETVSISKDKPFQRVDAYTADLKYDPEKKIFMNRREGSAISFGGEDYIIVAIHDNEVILSAASNQKRTTLRYAP